MNQSQLAASRLNQGEVGERLRRLRVGAGLAQAELAQRTGQSTGSVSMFENGRLPLTDEVVEAFARALGCTSDYLLAGAREPLASKPWLRAYADASKKAVDRAVADSVTALDLAERAGLKRVPDTLPLFYGDRRDEESIEVFAIEVREAAGIEPDAVVPNAIRAAERLGCVVLPMDDELGRHLGLSLRIDGTPVIRVARASNDAAKHVPGDRQRFTVAHELGHLTLHHATPPPDTPEQAATIEKEAHRFAGAFLAPGDALMSDLERLGGRVTLSTLSSLKAVWGVSIKSLVVRMQQLGVIGEDQARSLYKQISARRWNKSEPIPVGNEDAIWLRRAVEKRSHNTSRPTFEVASLVGLSTSYIEQWMDWAGDSPDEKSAEVIDIRTRSIRTSR